MWDDFEWNPELVPGLKLGLHIAQILLAFVGWCLGITVFSNTKAQITGQNGWTFAVFFLTIPAWIYLIGAPRFPRTRKFAEPHAMVAVDCFFTIIWLSAFATQASYNTANECGTACSQSKAIVAMGIFVCLLFGVTSFLSIYTLKHYQINGRLPGYDGLSRTQNIDPDKAAFSMAAPDDPEAYAPVHMNDHSDDHDADNSYGGGYGGPGGAGAGGSSYELEPDRHENPFDNRSENAFEGHDDPFSDTGLHSQVGEAGSAVGSSSHIYAPPTAAEAYDDDRPAQFPAANYDRVA